MALSVQCRNEPLRMFVKDVPLLSLNDLRFVAMDPECFAAASDYAKRFFPRTTLARAF